ncbi:nitroreductase family protein [Nannocystaceae bacterium ST9]
MNQNLAISLPAAESIDPWTSFEALVRSRRAVHQFSDRPVDAIDIEAMLDAARLAPSSFNLQPYTFYWLRSPDLRARLAELCLGQKAARTAAELIVCVAHWDEWQICADEHLAWLREQGVAQASFDFHADIYRRLRIFFARGPFNLLGRLRTLASWLIGVTRPTLRPPKGPREHATWAVKSASLACAHAMLAARARGLDTCPLEGFDEVRVAALLGLRGDRFALPMILAVGHREPSGRMDPQWRRDRAKLVQVL